MVWPGHATQHDADHGEAEEGGTGIRRWGSDDVVSLLCCGAQQSLPLF